MSWEARGHSGIQKPFRAFDLFVLNACIHTWLQFVHALMLAMIVNGLLNPSMLSLLARIRHTNALVIADRGFPFWPAIETVDVSVVDDLPTVCQLIHALRANHQFIQAFQAREFLRHNSRVVRGKFETALHGIPTRFVPHTEFKKQVPLAIGLIRTGDTIQYANTLLVSG